MMAEVKLDADELMGSLTITLKMPRAFGPRMWLVGRLIQLAAFISPVKV
jgi:hypothetical protein